MAASWLKKIGQIAIAVGKVSPVAGPILAALIPGRADDKIIAAVTSQIDPVVRIITDVEAIGAALTLSGDQKITAATILITQLFAPYVAKFGVADPMLFQKAINGIAQNYVDLLNSLKAEGLPDAGAVGGGQPGG